MSEKAIMENMYIRSVSLGKNARSATLNHKLQEALTKPLNNSVRRASVSLERILNLRGKPINAQIANKEGGFADYNTPFRRATRRSVFHEFVETTVH